MKKIFTTRDFAKAGELKDISDLLIIAFQKKGVIHLQNVELPESARVYYAKGETCSSCGQAGIGPKDRIVFEFDVKSTEFLALGQKSGMAEKKVIK